MIRGGGSYSFKSRILHQHPTTDEEELVTTQNSRRPDEMNIIAPPKLLTNEQDLHNILTFPIITKTGMFKPTCSEAAPYMPWIPCLLSHPLTRSLPLSQNVNTRGGRAGGELSYQCLLAATATSPPDQPLSSRFYSPCSLSVTVRTICGSLGHTS